MSRGLWSGPTKVTVETKVNAELESQMRPTFVHLEPFKLEFKEAMCQAENFCVAKGIVREGARSHAELIGLLPGEKCDFPRFGETFSGSLRAGDPNPVHLNKVPGKSRLMCFPNALRAVCRDGPNGKLVAQMFANARNLHLKAQLGGITNSRFEDQDLKKISGIRIWDEFQNLLLQWVGYFSFTQCALMFNFCFTVKLQLGRPENDRAFGGSPAEVQACFDFISELASPATAGDSAEIKNFKTKFTGIVLLDVLGNASEGKRLQQYLNEQRAKHGNDERKWDVFDGEFSMHHAVAIDTKAKLIFDDKQDKVLAFDHEGFKKAMYSGCFFMRCILYDPSEVPEGLLLRVPGKMEAHKKRERGGYQADRDASKVAKSSE